MDFELFRCLRELCEIFWIDVIVVAIVLWTGYNEKAPNLIQILFSKPLPLFDDKNYEIFQFYSPIA